MNEVFIFALISALITWAIAPTMIRYLSAIGLRVKDMGKFEDTEVPISGGIIVLSSTFLSIMAFVFYTTFIVKDTTSLTVLFAAVTSILIVTFIGFMDDLLVKRHGSEYVGLKRWQKPLLTLPAAIPLIAVKAGTSSLIFPFFGPVDIGLLYPLFLLPIGFLGASNMVNMLEGYNGIAAGMGSIYMLSLGLFAYINGGFMASLLALTIWGSLLVFFKFNFVPAKILPGDSLTYLLGATIACVAIIGNIEKAAIIVSLPFFIEFILKARGRFKKQSYGRANADGTITSLYDKIYSLPHLLTNNRRVKEKTIVFSMMALSFISSILLWVLWAYYSFLKPLLIS